MRRVLKDPDLQQQFEELGYVTFQMLNDSDIAQLLERKTELLKNNPTDNFGSCYISCIDDDVKHETSAAVRSVIEPRLAEFLHDDYILHSSSFIQKNSGADNTVTHLHPPVAADVTEPIAACWCPLQSSDEHSGVLQVVPRSHKLLWHVAIFPNYETYWQTFDDQLKEKHLVTLKLRPGEAILFEDSLIHAAAPNLVEGTRNAVAAQLVPRNAVPAFFIKSQDAQSPGHFDIYKAPDRYWHSDVMSGKLPPREEWEFLGTHANRNVALTEEQFEKLLENGVHIAPGVDPYAAVADLEPVAVMNDESSCKALQPTIPVPLARRALRKIRRLITAKT